LARPNRRKSAARHGKTRELIMTFANTSSRLLLAAATLLASATLPASAQERNPRIMVPHERGPTSWVPTPSGGIDGCWTADHRLYGRYRLTFCTNGYVGSTYTVSGGGLNCHGPLYWHQSWGTYVFRMSRTHCGWNTDWTADKFTCRLTGGGWDERSGPRVAVPSDYGRSRLDCDYQPAVWTYPQTSFSAHRSGV
jgi:hypothetical protein